MHFAQNLLRRGHMGKQRVQHDHIEASILKWHVSRICLLKQQVGNLCCQFAGALEQRLELIDPPDSLRWTTRLNEGAGCVYHGFPVVTEKEKQAARDSLVRMRERRSRFDKIENTRSSKEKEKPKGKPRGRVLNGGRRSLGRARGFFGRIGRSG